MFFVFSTPSDTPRRNTSNSNNIQNKKSSDQIAGSKNSRSSNVSNKSATRMVPSSSEDHWSSSGGFDSNTNQGPTWVAKSQHQYVNSSESSQRFFSAIKQHSTHSLEENAVNPASSQQWKYHREHSAPPYAVFKQMPQKPPPQEGYCTYLCFKNLTTVDLIPVCTFRIISFSFHLNFVWYPVTIFFPNILCICGYISACVNLIFRVYADETPPSGNFEQPVLPAPNFQLQLVQHQDSAREDVRETYFNLKRV